MSPIGACQEVRMRPESRALDLGSFLIKPVQRICKYPLLVRVRLLPFCRTRQGASRTHCVRASLSVCVCVCVCV
jgi:hypothetical protein